MKKGYLLLLVFFASLSAQAQVVQANLTEKEMMREIEALKKNVSELQQDKLQSARARYTKNYTLVLHGLEIINKIDEGIKATTDASNTSLFQSKLSSVNNPTSNALGFQLEEIINKTLEDNINTLPIVDTEKKRLKLQVGNLFNGLKNTFPPLQIISSVFSVISSFTTFNTRLEKLDNKKEKLIVEALNPISHDIIEKMNSQLHPYIVFYKELDEVNTKYRSAIYQHKVEYRDFIKDVTELKRTIGGNIDTNKIISTQLQDLFDINNSSMVNFDFNAKLGNEKVRALTANCSNISELVDMYKKFTLGYISVQENFYDQIRLLLKEKAKKLPVKDDAKIDELLEEFNSVKNGGGFENGSRERLKTIFNYLSEINTLRI